MATAEPLCEGDVLHELVLGTPAGGADLAGRPGPGAPAGRPETVFLRARARDGAERAQALARIRDCRRDGRPVAVMLEDPLRGLADPRMGLALLALAVRLLRARLTGRGPGCRAFITDGFGQDATFLAALSGPAYGEWNRARLVYWKGRRPLVYALLSVVNAANLSRFLEKRYILLLGHE